MLCTRTTGRCLLQAAFTLAFVYNIHVAVKIYKKYANAGCEFRINSETDLEDLLNISRQHIDNFEEINIHYTKLPLLRKTDYFGCKEFRRLPNSTENIAENNKGNRGITFLQVQLNDAIVPAVFKQAHSEFKTPAEHYKYNTAKKEIEYLAELNGHPGFPKLFGSCVTPHKIQYVVERIAGLTLCNDNGTTPSCAEAKDLIRLISISDDPVYAALKLAYSTVELFQLLEAKHLFFEDISGLNLMVGYDWDLIIVDADSFVYYDDARLFSQLSCESSEACTGPMGNLWIGMSLNAKIYANCLDLHGICESGNCRGYDVGLHACGLANWYLCRFSQFFTGNMKIQYNKVCTCLREPQPSRRCSFSYATKQLGVLLQQYLVKKYTI